MLLKIAVLGFCLLSAPMQCIKIGVSKSDNNSDATTSLTTTTTTTTEFLATTIATINDVEINSTGSSLPDAASTPSQTFPPRRKTPKPRPTPKPTKRLTTPATTAAAAAAVPTANTLDASTSPATASHRKDTRLYYCACDLQDELCEVNCCCDRDCSQESLQVFSCLPEQHTRLEDFQYNHGLPTCQISDGWLCVFRSHTKPAKMKVNRGELTFRFYYKVETTA